MTVVKVESNTKVTQETKTNKTIVILSFYLTLTCTRYFILFIKFHDKIPLMKMDPNSALRGKVSHVLALSSHLAQPININANIYHWPDYLNIRSKAAHGLLTVLSPRYQTVLTLTTNTSSNSLTCTLMFNVSEHSSHGKDLGEGLGVWSLAGADGPVPWGWISPGRAPKPVQ